MNIEIIISFEMDQNCYLIYGDSKKGVLIDPGENYQGIIDKINELGVEVEYIFLTHCHYDHIESVNQLRENKKLVCSKECSRNIQSMRNNLSGYVGKNFKLEKADILLSDGDKIEVDGIKFTAIATPGHTNGGMCYLAEGKLFTGDTLFRVSVGRHDFPTSNGEAIMHSIKEKLYALPDKTVVYPGHGESTTIRYEKNFNMYISQ